ncbi:MAG: tRNA (adenosine(37)-N6)-threonylcarbamoyltransferase complex dimerization subunit type 1 TsaB [Caldilineaceae bacterium]|nr:tRNA (adenosine(37)-N6)-threonylcarbamoyltransferase complex dimerization subunit type 1 TsaB [Caldilineaceae bacterium]MBP8109244.1 tRNA (adenosine(37)-N6)-threonylcarbamoyltransferase complex dimerization subunit type 1 TsaB [Caldilineaceae bacterium]MBP8125682.1 tRNA (adenosine(37)-N6)-threonylcarbamoyltransferase complex dimerization subunit type 1 TsaB [Caldilineaceae bacterium]MBP9073072.1 tRNA (adenosine(37)-N6)-threonylcarbamoyltransferase complex dimerization subunit type 1 TsaB [Cal
MLLALDTATTTASIALYDLETDHLLAELTWQARRRQTQELTPAIQDLLARMDLTPADITALAATTGPGSFTGVRIAISMAKGIALGLPALPTLIGLPTLSVTAAPWVDVAAKLSPAPRIVACIQAGRGRYNWAAFSPAHPLHRPGVDDHGAGKAVEFVATLAAFAAPVWLVGEVGEDLAASVAGLAHVNVVDNIFALRRAGHLARLAALHLAAGHWDDLATFQPLYLQAP